MNIKYLFSDFFVIKTNNDNITDLKSLKFVVQVKP